MRIAFIAGLFVFATAAAQASSTLRVGSHVLSAGDSAERVSELLGRPSSKSHQHSSRSSRSGHSRRSRTADNNGQAGEQWRYRRDGHSTVVTIVDGRVTDIEDRRL
ncbi:DUF2845 domain-containing protein [Rhodanobacter sp. L36]|uniref:DUF2845 domain-containing protein n=1 Tax=Rhodanobacter sp. L36 TaxID=1747221 RepID=UPI00131D4EDA|nr:DUF2845 domain-containing protein [Rhodanobacter sp. L36]